MASRPMSSMRRCSRAVLNRDSSFIIRLVLGAHSQAQHARTAGISKPKLASPSLPFQAAFCKKGQVKHSSV